MASMKRIFFLAAVFSSVSLSLSAQETRTRAPAAAVDLLPASSWLVYRSPSYSTLWKLLESHPLWKLYGEGERGKLLEQVARVLVKKAKEKAPDKVDQGLLEQTGSFLQRGERLFSQGLEPARLWLALTRFGLGTGKRRWGRSKKRVSVDYNPGILLLLEYPEGEEARAGRAWGALGGFLREGIQGKALKTGVRDVHFHGKTFLSFHVSFRGFQKDAAFLGRYGRFIALSLGTPWPLFEAENAATGRAPSLRGRGLARVFQEDSSNQVVFALDPGLFPFRWIPEPIPLAWMELGLPSFRWIQGRWDPATGKTVVLAKADKPVEGYLSDLARRVDPDDLARFLPADTAAFAVVPFDWKGLAGRLEPFLVEAARQGLLPKGLSVEKLVSGFEGDSLAASPMPLLSGLKGMGVALRFHRGVPTPDVVFAFRLTKKFFERSRAFVEEKVRKWPNVRVTEVKGLKIYRGPWLFGISFVFKDGWAFVTPRPGMLRAFLPVIRGEKVSLADQKKYKEVRSGLSGAPSLAFYYVDGSKAVQTGEGFLRFLLPVASSLLNVQGLVDLLHSGDELENILSGYGGGVFLEKAGVSYKSTFPFSPLNLFAFTKVGVWGVVKRILYPGEGKGKTL